MKKIIALSLFLLFISTSIVAQTKEEKKAIKSEQALKEYESLKKLLNSGTYEFVGEWATTNSGRRINLFSNTNYLRIDAGEADIFLPFFGTSQNAGYGSGGAIEFKGKLQDYQITFNDKKQKATLKFTAKDEGTESFNFSIEIFGSGSTNVSVNSSYRSHIRYSGKTKKYEKKENEE
jgi:hypothetical protein